MKKQNILSARTQREIRLHESLLTVREASEWLGIHEKTLYRWVALGKLPHVRVGGHAVRLRHSDLLEIVKCHGTLKGSF